MSTITIEKKFQNDKLLNNFFLSTGNEWDSTEYEELEIIESGKGEVLMGMIEDEINEAQEMICLQSFLIQDISIIDAMRRAVGRGVKVFVMDSAEAKLNRLIEEDEDFIANEYVKMIDEKFKNKFIHRQAENLHAKFILIDPNLYPRGFMFTGNFNKKPFVENPELAVCLGGNQVSELFKLFVYHFWEHTTDEQDQSDTFVKVKPLGQFKPPKLEHVLVTSPNPQLSNLKPALIQAVKSAKKEISFSTFGFDITHELSKEILNKLQKGITVNVFCRPREKTIKGHLVVLFQNGAKAYCHPLIHAKSLVIDDEIGFVFSANFEKHGMDQGFEVGVLLNEDEVSDLLAIYSNWKNCFPYEFIAEKPLRDVSSYYGFDKKGKLEKITPKSSKEKSNTRRINRAKDFIDFFSNFKKPKDFDAKEIILKRIATFNMLKHPIKTKEKIGDGLEKVIYQTKTTKKKKEITKEVEAILISKDKKDIQAQIAALDKESFRNLEMYMSNGTSKKE